MPSSVGASHQINGKGNRSVHYWKGKAPTRQK